MVDFDGAASADLSLVSVARMSDEEARKALMALRWPSSNGRPVCPRCGRDEVYFRKSRRTFLCKRCVKDFSIVSGTIFAFSKVSAKDLLLAACIFAGGAKGVSGLQLSLHGKTVQIELRVGPQDARTDAAPGFRVARSGAGGWLRDLRQTQSERSTSGFIKKYENRRVVVVAREPLAKAFVGKKGIRFPHGSRRDACF